MISHFLNLEWKQFFRSASFNKSIGLKIMMIFFALYFMVSFLVMGIALYPGLKKFFPDQDPFVVANGFICFLSILVLDFSSEVGLDKSSRCKKYSPTWFEPSTRTTTLFQSSLQLSRDTELSGYNDIMCSNFSCVDVLAN